MHFQLSGLAVLPRKRPVLCSPHPPVAKGLRITAERHVQGMAGHVDDACARQQHLDVPHQPQVAQHLVHDALGAWGVDTAASEGAQCGRW